MFVNKVDKLMLLGHNCRVPEVRVLLYIAINIVIDCIWIGSEAILVITTFSVEAMSNWNEKWDTEKRVFHIWK